jgi:hypothetical protein
MNSGVLRMSIQNAEIIEASRRTLKSMDCILPIERSPSPLEFLRSEAKEHTQTILISRVACGDVDGLYM